MSTRKVHLDRIAEQKTSFPNLFALVPGITFCFREKTERTLETPDPSKVTCKACKRVKVLAWNPETRSHYETTVC